MSHFRVILILILFIAHPSFADQQIEEIKSTLTNNQQQKVPHMVKVYKDTKRVQLVIADSNHIPNACRVDAENTKIYLNNKQILCKSTQ